MTALTESRTPSDLGEKHSGEKGRERRGETRRGGLWPAGKRLGYVVFRKINVD